MPGKTIMGIYILLKVKQFWRRYFKKYPEKEQELFSEA